MKGLFYLIPVCLFCLQFTASADWKNWRGPHYNGSAAECATPEKFNSDQGVLWKCPLPGPSAGTPIVSGKQIFLSSIDSQSKKLLAIAVDRESGKTLWSHVAGSGYQPKGHGEPHRIDNRSNYASPSPVTDGQTVLFFFGNGDLVTFDIKGQKKWSINIQKQHGDFSFQWTFASTPTLWKGKIYIQILQRNQVVHGRGKEGNPSYLLCMDLNSGKTLWKKTRSSDAQMESLESFATPIPYRGKNGFELLVIGGDVITGHDFKDGKELWRWGTWNPGHRQKWWRHVPSPVTGSGLVLICAPKKAPVYAVNLDLRGDISGDKGMAWVSQKKEISSDVPTPLYYNKNFYILSDVKRSLSSVTPKDGKINWLISLPGKYKWRASPTACDGKIYLMNHHADVLVVDAKSGKILNQAGFGEKDDDDTRSSIAISNGQLFIRTNSNLFCVGQKEKVSQK